MRLYRFFQWLLRLATEVFYRHIEVVGRLDLPREGDAAVVFCGNHPNSLLDPILITAHCGRVVHFAAKDTLFENPLLRVCLRALGAVPVRRRQDHPDGPLDNERMFDALYQVLGDGRSVGIFPEGLSHNRSQLAPLKTGAARIAIGAKKRFPNRTTYVVPTGLIYFTRSRFRSSVLIQFGEPIAIDRALAAEGEGDAVRELTGEIDTALRSLTINADSWEQIRVLDGVRHLYQPEGLSLTDKVELARRFNTLYPQLKDEPEVQRIYRRVRAFLRRMSATGLSDELLAREVSVRETAWRVLAHLVLVIIYLPLFVVGAPLHLPLGLLFKVAGRYFSPRKDVVATTKFVLGFLTLLLLYVGLAVTCGLLYGLWWGVCVGIVLPWSGRAVLQVISRANALRHIALTSLRLVFLRKELALLRAERAALATAVIAAVEKFRPPDLEPVVKNREAT